MCKNQIEYLKIIDKHCYYTYTSMSVIFQYVFQAYSATFWASKMGKEKVVVGIPFYCHAFKLLNPLMHGYHALPQGNHVAKVGKDPIYRTNIIVRKRPCCQKLYL
jgi:hypothetical protein